MRVLNLKNTDLCVSRLSFGTATLHHCVTSGERQTLLRYAFDAGFTHFDTSPYYGYGLAEAELGRLPQEIRNRMTVSSKVGLYPPLETTNWPILIGLKAVGRIRPLWGGPLWNGSLKQADRSLEASLRRLNRDLLDLLFLHEPVWSETLSDAWFPWLESKRSEGKIRFWGIAGPCEKLVDFLDSETPLAQIIQCRDSRPGCEADPCLLRGQSPHLVYGVLRGNPPGDAPEILRWALRRHPHASILVSSRKTEHVGALSDWADEK